MTTSVIIVSYNTVDLLRACLQTVVGQTPEPEVIVVDNGSKDGSPKMVAKEFKQVKLIRNESNKGFATANNQGFAVAGGEYVVMLNSDTELRGPDDLEKLTSYLAQHPEVGVLAPRLVNGEGRVQASASWTEPTLLTQFYEYTLLNRLLYRLFANQQYPGKLLLSPEELTRPQDVAEVIGACLVFRRSLLTEVGQLDERFFFFLEETDFNRRVRHAGYTIRYYPAVEVLHHWGGSIDESGKLDMRFRYYFPSLYTFFRKHHGPVYETIARLIAIVGSAGLVALLTVLSVPAKLLGMRTQRIIRNQLKLYKPILAWHLGSRG